MNIFENASRFIYRNARPIDLARFKYHFENETKEEVMNTLTVYHNDDGGFGSALEADSFNPDSSPIQTWAATEIIKEIDFTDSSHPVIQNILRYLDSEKDFDVEQNQWLNVVESNNHYPCAVWWKYGENGSDFKYNPTAALAGFAIKYADSNSRLYHKCCEIAKQAYNWLVSNESVEEMHILNCFIRLYEYCIEADVQLFDMDAFKTILSQQISSLICKNAERWASDYCPRPSDFIKSKSSPFYADNVEHIKKECDFIKQNQLPDGSFKVLWQWYNDYTEFVLAENWWKSELIIKYLLFLKTFYE